MGLGKTFARIGLIVGLVLGPAISRADTLASALAHAYEHSGLLEQNRALLRAADEGVAQAVAALRPTLSWSAQASHSLHEVAPGSGLNSASLSLMGDLLLFDNGVSKLAVDAQKEAVLGARQGLLNVEQQVLLRAIQAYMNVVRDTEFVTLRQSNVRVLTQEFRASQDRFEVGEVTRTDVSFAEARLAAARSLLAAAEGSLARSVEEFRAAVGRNPGTLADVSAAPTARTVAAAKAFALRNHPSLLQVQHNVTAAELTIERAESALLPRITLGGRLSIDESGDDNGSISISAGSPIYRGGAIMSGLRQVTAQRDAQRAGLHVASVSIEQGVGNAYANYSVAQAGRQAYEQQVNAAQVAFEGVREEANLGSRTTLDVLNAEQELLDARASLVSARVDEVIASYAILASMGLLTAEHLRLGVQLYDPTSYYEMVKDAPVNTSEQGRALDRVLQALGK